MTLVKKVKVVPGLQGWLLIEFDDNSQKLTNINPIMQGVLEKLKDQTFFENVFVDPELQTVTWPGELDLDPDNLYQRGIDIELVKYILKAIKDNKEFEEFIDRSVV